MDLFSLFTEENIKLAKDFLNLDDVSFILYFILVALYFILYKVVKDVLNKLSTTKKSDIELMITHYTEIQNYANTINQSSNEEQYASFYNILRNSYNFIEYPVYKKILEIKADNTLQEVQKINEIQQIVSTRNTYLIADKNKFLDYSFNMSPIPTIKLFVHEFRHIVSAAIVSLLILYLIMTLIFIVILQPNKFEMIVTFMSAILLAFSIFMYIDKFKEFMKYKWVNIAYPILMLLMLGAIFCNGLLLYIDIIIFSVILITLVIIEFVKSRNP